MLQLCNTRLAVITARAISEAATKLNALLDLTNRPYPVPRDELKQFLTHDVKPILAGTELDRRGNATDSRHFLGQLTRDAAFAAVIVDARPEASFVQSLLTCIRKDNERMRFVAKMSSPQASKIIEHLTKTGVDDEEVYSILISRLNFASLRELSRAMFALAEAGFHALNILVVAPLYSGDKWVLESAEATALSNPAEWRQPNTFEAVRVLRVLSKSCRWCAENLPRASPERSASIPKESLHLLRNNLLQFIFENGSTLRGAHWLNIARALLSFPSEHSALPHLSMVYPPIVGEVQTALSPFNGGANADAICVISCTTVAAVALNKVFQYAERRSSFPASQSGISVSAASPFDLNHSDLVKLLSIINQFSHTIPMALIEERVEHVLEALLSQIHLLRLRDLVSILQIMRRSAQTPKATAVTQKIVEESGRRLMVPDSTDVMTDIPFRVVVYLAAALAALHATRCDGFVNYFTKGTNVLPQSLTADTGLAIINALTSLAKPDLAACHKVVDAVLNRVLTFYETQLQTGPLLYTFPAQVAKMLRGCVLMDYIPPPDTLRKLLSPDEAPLCATPAIRQAGGLLVFDLSRSYAHFVKQARTTAPQREEDLWRDGVLQTIVPLARICTKELAYATEHYRRGASSSHTALSWRTTMEMLFLYIDKQQNVGKVNETARQLREVVAPCEEVLKNAAEATRAHLARCVNHIHHVDEALRRARAAPFSTNCCVHFISALLMFEYLVYNNTSPVGRSGLGKGETIGHSAAVEEAALSTLRERYNTFLNAPISDRVSDSPMDVLRYIFKCPVASATGAPLEALSVMDKRHALEITTALPFAISLVADPGPANEFFTEQCMTLLVTDGDDAPSSRDRDSQ